MILDDFIHSFGEGFVGSFVLAGAIVAAMVTGIGRVTLRLYGQFMEHQPLQITPRKKFRAV